MRSVLIYLLLSVNGYLIAENVCSRSLRASWIPFFLAPGLGLGIASATMMLDLMMFNCVHYGLLSAIQGVMLLALLILRQRTKSKIDMTLNDGWPLLLIVAAGFVLVLFNLLKAPYGNGIDVWAIWRFKARLIFEGGWDRLFAPSLSYTHRDYPLLYPGMILWGYFAEGRENILSSWIIAVTFSLSIAGLMAASVERPRRWMGVLAGLLIISTPQFTGMGGSQYADILVAYFCLAGAVLYIHFIEEPSAWCCGILAGVCVGLGALVKNEGLLFALCFFIAAAAIKKFRTPFLAALPFMLLTLIFKALSGAPNELINIGLVGRTYSTEALWTRLWQIGDVFFREILRENAWVYGWIFVAASVILLAKRILASSRLIFLGLVVFLMLGGYALSALLMTPEKFDLFCRATLDRCLLHVYPLAVLFGFFLMEKGSKKWL